MFSDDDSIPERWAFGYWLERYAQASSQRFHKDVMVAHKLKSYMEAAGYVDVHEIVRAIHIDDWGPKPRTKKAGTLWRQNLELALQGWSHKTLGPEGLGMGRDEIEALLACVRADLSNPNIHAYQVSVSRQAVTSNADFELRRKFTVYMDGDQRMLRRRHCGRGAIRARKMTNR